MFEKAQEFLEYNIALLGLSDWHIELEFVNTKDLADRYAKSEVEYSEVTKTAIIRLTEFSDKQSILHELMHIKFALIDDQDDKTHNRLLHQLINDMAVIIAGLQEIPEND